jgi:hypothetical protein
MISKEYKTVLQASNAKRFCSSFVSPFFARIARTTPEMKNSLKMA